MFLNTVKVTIIHKAIYRLNAIPIKIPMALFTEVEQKFLDFFETQKPPNRHSNLKKEKWSWKDQALVPNYTTK